MPGLQNRDPIERFMEKVNKTKTCWLWTATKVPFGYGSFSYQSIKVMAHRFSYMTFVGKIPKGKFVLHTCDVPACVNPAHLFLGTQTDNLKDMTEKGRRRNQNDGKTHCIRGHELSGHNLLITKLVNRTVRNCRICRNAWANAKYHRGIKSLAI